MKQTLLAFEIADLNDVGTSPTVRICADEDYTATTGEVHLAGSDRENYEEVSLESAGGNGWTFPNTTLDTTDDSTDPNASLTAFIMNSRGKMVRTLFERWCFTASFGATVSYIDAELFNLRRAPLRDDETYSKRQIDLLIQSRLGPLTAKAVGSVPLVGGMVEVALAALDADSPIILAAQDDGVRGTLRVFERTPGVSFVIASSDGADNGVVSWFLF